MIRPSLNEACPSPRLAHDPMPRFEGPETIDHEGPVRSLLETAFAALEGRVESADACYERVARAEIQREFDGRRTLTPFAVKSGLVVRLVGEAGRMLEASLGDLSPIEARLRLDEALRVLEAQPPGDGRLAPLPTRERRHFGSTAALPSASVLVTRLPALLDVLDRTIARAAPAGIALTHRARAYVQVEDKVVADLEGLWRTQSLPQAFIRVELHAARGAARARYLVSFGALAGLDALAENDGTLSPGLAAELGLGLERVIALLGARALTPEERRRLTHYVLAPSAMVFVHEACGHNFEADIVQQGGSGLFEVDGRPVDPILASPAVRLVDGPLESAVGPGGFGGQFMDDEGVPVSTVTLIDHGRVVGLLHDRETAGRFGVPSNGRGFSELGHPRMVRMTDTWLLPAAPSFATQNLESFLDGITLGVWLESSFGGEVNGEGMSTTIQVGRLIRDGVLTDEFLLPCTLSVRTRGALKTVERFFGEPQLPGVGFCGKDPLQYKTVALGGCAARLSATESIGVAW
jgi:predicted Zn-dependent protease